MYGKEWEEHKGVAAVSLAYRHSVKYRFGKREWLRYNAQISGVTHLPWEAVDVLFAEEKRKRWEAKKKLVSMFREHMQLIKESAARKNADALWTARIMELRFQLAYERLS